MNVKDISALTLLLTFSFCSTAQKVDTKISWLAHIPDAINHVSYNAKEQLTIEDFQGNPDAAIDAVAITASGFSYQAAYHYDGSKARLELAVYCSFNKNKSWMKARGKNAYVLAHEQRHFDISYLGALEFIKKIKQVAFQQHNYSEKLKSVYREVIQEMTDLQRQYDTETNNGINTVSQEAWNKKIAKNLKDAAKQAIL